MVPVLHWNHRWSSEAVLLHEPFKEYNLEMKMIFFLRVVDARRGVHRASNFVFAYSFEFEIENGQYFNSTFFVLEYEDDED
jgi:hypothetical protein